NRATSRIQATSRIGARQLASRRPCMRTFIGRTCPTRDASPTECEAKVEPVSSQLPTFRSNTFGGGTMAAIEFPEEHVVVDLEKPPPSAPSTAEVPADFDPASHMARQLLAIADANYRSAEQATRHANYVQGQALMRISELELYKVRGFTSFRDYVELHLKLAAATAHIMISV